MEDAQAVVSDLGVSGIKLRGVNGLVLDAPEGQVVVHPEDMVLRQSITGLQTGPAVLPVHKLIAETQISTRVAAQIGDFGKAAFPQTSFFMPMA